MIVTTHQPTFLPWPGLFYKAMNADCLVLLDAVQFPRGRSWMNRNRLKSEMGEMWITVPVRKKGRGLQNIQSVEIADEASWRRRHLKGISQNYAHAPYYESYSPEIEAIYREGRRSLLSLNVDLIRFFWEVLSLKARLLMQSELGVTGRGTELLIAICEHLHASEYTAFAPAEKYLDGEHMRRKGVTIRLLHYHPPVYPQLWGDFIANLSTLDLLLNCGPKSGEIIGKA